MDVEVLSICEYGLARKDDGDGMSRVCDTGDDADDNDIVEEIKELEETEETEEIEDALDVLDVEQDDDERFLCLTTVRVDEYLLVSSSSGRVRKGTTKGTPLRGTPSLPLPRFQSTRQC